ncbi:LysR family transcriptional regulator [Brucella sp. C7-11G]
MTIFVMLYDKATGSLTANRMFTTNRTIISNRLCAVSIRDLVLVSAVWKRSSFRTVARELAISPSGLSHQVRKVEEALGTTIFERSSQNVRATPEGEILLAQIEDILTRVGKLDLLAMRTSKPFGGHLRMGTISALGAYIMPHFTRVFEAGFPDVTLDFLEGKTAGVTQRLRVGEIDMMLSCRLTEGSDLETKPLFIERFDLIVNAAHPFAGQSSVNIRDIESNDLIIVSDGEGYSEDTLSSALQRSSPSDVDAQRSEVRGLSFETIGALVSSRGGASIIPSLSIPRLSAFPKVRIVRISGGAPQRTIYASWRKSSPHQDTFHRLCNALGELQAVCDSAHIPD